MYFQLINGEQYQLSAQVNYIPSNNTYLYASVDKISRDRYLDIDVNDSFCYVSGFYGEHISKIQCKIEVIDNKYHVSISKLGICYVICFYNKYIESSSYKLIPGSFGIISLIILLINLF
jgi:hypothetical protein